MRSNTLYSLIFLVILQTGFSNNDNTEDPDYILIRSNEGINLYYKWINTEENKKVRIIKLQVIINDSVPNIIQAITNDILIKRWLTSVKIYSDINQIDLYNWYSYIQFEAPWPLKNQDCILKYNVKPSNNNINIRLTNTPDYIKEIEGVKRMGHLEGKWVLTTISKNRTNVEFEMYSNQQPLLPRWLVDPIIQNAMWKSIFELRNMIVTNH